MAVHLSNRSKTHTSMRALMEASKKPDEIVPSPIVDLLARLNRIALIVPDPTVRFPIDSSPLLKTELDCAIEL